MTTCLCGCGRLISPPKYPSEQRKYIHGHNPRGKPNPWAWNPNSTRQRTFHDRANKMMKAKCCSLFHIGGCRGPIHVHHIDEDVYNNDPGNLTPLCQSHHYLVHKGRIDLRDPVMPTFYTDGGGKRRYKKATFCVDDSEAAHAEYHASPTTEGDPS